MLCGRCDIYTFCLSEITPNPMCDCQSNKATCTRVGVNASILQRKKSDDMNV